MGIETPESFEQSNRGKSAMLFCPGTSGPEKP